MESTDRLFGIRVRVEKWLPPGTIMPDPTERIHYPDGFNEWDNYQKLKFFALHAKVLYISPDVREAIIRETEKYATSW